MGKGGGGTTTTKTEPWDAQKDFLKTGMQAASSLFSPWTTTTQATEPVYRNKLVYNPSTETYENQLIKGAKNSTVTGMNTVNNALAPEYYQGNTVAPQSSWTKQALQMQANAANGMAKNPLMTAANAAAKSIAGGQAQAGNTGLFRLNALSAAAPVTQAQALQGNTAANKLQALGSSSSLSGNAGYKTLGNLAGQATGKGNTGLTQLNKYAGTNFNKGNAGLQNLKATTGEGINAGNAALAQLTELATNDNPYMDELYKRANGQAQASLDANFNRAGRYGSGAHEAAAADAANNLANQMYSDLYGQRINAANAASSAYSQGIGQGITAQQAAGQLYNAGKQLGVNAASDAAGAYNQALGQRINAAQAQGGMYGQDLSTRAGALANAGSQYGQGLNTLVSAYGQQAGAANNAGGLYNTGVGQQAAAASIAQQLAQQPYTDAAMLSEAGGVKDDYNQQLINADIDRYNYDAQRQLQALSNYNALISGNFGGTSTATGQQASGSRLGNALGGGLSGAAIGTQIMPGWGTAIGAGAGALLGLFGS